MRPIVNDALTDEFTELLRGLTGVARDFDPQPVWITQPLHTVYAPGDRCTVDTPVEWQDEALAAVAQAGGFAALATAIGVAADWRSGSAASAERRIRRQPIADLRIDFEDGYGTRSDTEEDRDARAAGAAAAAIRRSAEAPDRIGIRIKPLDTRGAHRGLRTLERFLDAYGEAGGFEGADASLRITLAKVMHSEQISVLDRVLRRLEVRHQLVTQTLQIEVQVEVPHLIASVLDTGALDRISANPRVRALHFGTYDYTSALGIVPSEQHSLHPVAVHAKRVMQAVAATHAIEVCDGSSNLLPTGSAEQRLHAWRTHANLVTTGLRDGLPQGWDLHPAQLASRFLAGHAVLRAEVPSAIERLVLAHDGVTHGIADEPATLRMMAAVIARALRVGAIEHEEVVRADTRLTPSLLEHVARTGRIMAV